MIDKQFKKQISFNSPTTPLAELVQRYNQARAAKCFAFYVRSSTTVDYLVRSLCFHRYVYSAVLLKNNNWYIVTSKNPVKLKFLNKQPNYTLRVDDIYRKNLQSAGLVVYISTTNGLMTLQEAKANNLGGRLMICIEIL